MPPRKTIDVLRKAATPLSEADIVQLKTSMASFSRKDRMLYIVDLDPDAAMRLVRQSYNATIGDGFGHIGDLVSVLELVSDPRLQSVKVLDKLLDAGLLLFVRDCITSPTFLTMQPNHDNENILASCTLQLFNGLLAAVLRVDAHHLLPEILDDLLVEPWESLWSSRNAIIQSGFRAELLSFLASSGILISRTLEECEGQNLGPGNRFVDLLFFTWFHLKDSGENAMHAAASLSRIMFDEPTYEMLWPDILAVDGLLVSSLVCEYGPDELVRRVESALKRLTKQYKMLKSSSDDQWGLYAAFILLAAIPGFCCHAQCQRLLVRYNIISAIEDFTSVYPDRQTCWRASACVTLAIEEYHRGSDGAPGTYEHVQPQTLGKILADGMFYLYADTMSSIPEEGNRETLVELFRRHPCSQAPSRVHCGFWLRTKPTYWYMCLLGLRAAAYREHGKPTLLDIQFLERFGLSGVKRPK